VADNEAKIVLTAEDRFGRAFAALKADLSGAGQQIRGIQSILSGGGGGFGLPVAAGAAAAAVGAMAVAVNRLADDLDKLNDAQVIVGDTVENLSALEDVARRNGGDLDLVTTALVKMNKALKDADPDSNAAKALKAIGLDAAKLRSEAPTQALQDIAVAMSGFADDGNKARLTQELFGKSLKEVAPLLRDITESGKLNATVTTEQAKAAKLFNDNIFELQTNVGNLARDLAGSVIEGVNEFNKSLTTSGGVLKELGGIAAAIAVPLQAVAVLGANVAYVLKGIGTELGGIAAQAAALASGDFRGFAVIGKAMREDAKAARLEIDAFSDRVLRVGAISADTLAGFKRTAASFGGKLPTVAELGEGPKVEKAKVSEAQRYLEALQKQGEKLQDLTELQRVLKDIEAKRIEGLTPALAAQIKQEAAKIDLQKEINGGKEKEVAFQKLLTDLAAKELKVLEEKQAALDKLFTDIEANSRNSAISLINDTEVGRLRQAEVQLEALRDLMKDPAFQDADSGRAFIEAIEKIKESVSGVAAQGKTEFEKLADVIEKTMDRSTDAILDFVVEGKGSVQDLFKAFSRDVLRQFIEAPVRDAMKEVASLIKKAVSPAEQSGGGEGLLASIFKIIAGGAGGGSGNALAFLDQLAPAGAAGFANGGSVKAGSLLRVNENGTETFIPGQDGTILSASQTRARAAGQGAAAVNVTQVFNVGGDVSPGTVRLLESMIDRNNAKLQRSMRTGGAFAS
jgi:hypothetical protein